MLILRDPREAHYRGGGPHIEEINSLSGAQSAFEGLFFRITQSTVWCTNHAPDCEDATYRGPRGEPNHRLPSPSDYRAGRYWIIGPGHMTEVPDGLTLCIVESKM
ncbi:hypothetical protein M8J76_006672 [Diaphorina citri]|nr:hypothetical protein M8J76_006672 [Diaphorina citri]